MRKFMGGPGVAALALWASSCGGSTASAPNPVPSAPQATPTPAPTPTPTPAAIFCGTPTPPPLYGFRVKVHSDLGFKKVLDSRVMVKSATYCNRLGYPGEICVARDEGASDAITCGNLLTGIASQTGRYGPNWYWNDQPCRGIQEGGDAPGCKEHPENQFQVFAFGPGIYSACGDSDRVCHGLEIK